MTLHQMGDPEYIGMLVCMKDRSLAICSCGKETKDAINVSTGREAEIYSSDLCEELKQVNSRIRDDRSYRIYGKLYLGKIMVFGLADI